VCVARRIPQAKWPASSGLCKLPASGSAAMDSLNHLSIRPLTDRASSVSGNQPNVACLPPPSCKPRRSPKQPPREPRAFFDGPSCTRYSRRHCAFSGSAVATLVASMHSSTKCGRSACGAGTILQSLRSAFKTQCGFRWFQNQWHHASVLRPLRTASFYRPYNCAARAIRRNYWLLSLQYREGIGGVPDYR